MDTDTLAKPAGLGAKGSAAYDAIRRILHESDCEYTGGCRAFYSPSEWRERGEVGADNAVLIVVYDGSEVKRLFEYVESGDWDSDSDLPAELTETYAELDQLGLYSESLTCWASGIYES